MNWAILYPAAYSIMMTVALLVIVFAQVERKQNEGKPINYQIIKTLFILTTLMWFGTIAAAFLV